MSPQSQHWAATGVNHGQISINDHYGPLRPRLPRASLTYLLADLALEAMIGQMNIQQTDLLDLESTILGLRLA